MNYYNDCGCGHPQVVAQPAPLLSNDMPLVVMDGVEVEHRVDPQGRRYLVVRPTV